jgi:predicted TIM-barrel fold metal-dependent hydrolase
MKVTTLATALLFAVGAYVLAQQAREPIIDVHLHTHPANRFGKVGVPNPVTSKPSAAVTDRALLDAALAQMRRYNIVAAVGFSDRESVERWRKAAGDRIIGGMQIDQDISGTPVAELRRDIRQGRVRVIGEIGGQWIGLAPGDPAFEPYLSLAEELDVPVGFHTGIGPANAPFECCPKFRIGLGNPALIEDVLIRHPQLRVYLMHAGRPFLEETMALMSVYPQVYADISVIDWIIPRDEFHAYVQALIRAGLGKQLMFGSDQMIWPETIGMAVEAVQSIPGITESQKRDIFYNNAVRFFHLNERDLKSWPQ